MKILVTGGAGYVGSHFVNEAKQAHKIVVVDNCKQKDLIPKVQYWNVDIRDKKNLLNVFQMVKPDIVDHLGGLTNIRQALTKPSDFYETNITGSLNVFDCMRIVGCKKIIFMSAGAVYEGGGLLNEQSKTNPTNAYSFSKWVIENILKEYFKVYGISSITFRPFCISGCDEKIGRNYENPQQLVPNLVKSFFGHKLDIHGDGSAIRDYIHISDIVEAHLLAIKKLEKPICEVYNLGLGKGYSVMEVIRKAEKIVGKKANYSFGSISAGNPKAIADCRKAKKELGWKPKKTIDDIIKSEYNYYANRFNP